MPVQKLPPELVSLVHHIELNKSGWLNKGIQRLILAAVWLCGKAVSIDVILQFLKQEFSINTDAGRLKVQIDALRSEGSLISLPDGSLQVSEKALKEFEKSLADVDQVEKLAKQKFAASLKECCPDLPVDELWGQFNEQLLFPLMREIGARTYELVAGKSFKIDQTLRFPEFLDRFSPSIRNNLRNAIIAFLDPKSADARTYVLRCLNTHFFLEAGNLSDDTLQAVMRVNEQSPVFAMFADTNFLFSILGLHDNPSNDAAESLMTLMAELPKQIQCKLYAFPLTIDETKRVIGAHLDSLGRIRMTPNMAQGALAASLSGVATRFALACKKAN